MPIYAKAGAIIQLDLMFNMLKKIRTILKLEFTKVYGEFICKEDETTTTITKMANIQPSGLVRTTRKSFND